jgi:hypothetical protein
MSVLCDGGEFKMCIMSHLWLSISNEEYRLGVVSYSTDYTFPISDNFLIKIRDRQAGSKVHPENEPIRQQHFEWYEFFTPQIDYVHYFKH